MSPTMIWEPRTYSQTQRVIYDMLTESTGRHLLDSGGAYGRHWERNQRFSIEDFAARPMSTLTGRWGLEVTHELFHWLDDRVEYEEEGDLVFEQWGTSGDRASEPWLPLAELFAEMLEGTGIYGDGDPVVVNTYNGEDLLSQTIQYVYFELDETVYITPPSPWHGNRMHVTRYPHEDETLEGVVVLEPDTYVLLQIHNGCDVRGGYTRPRLFRVMEEIAILDNARASIGCSGCDASWYTDDGYHFYSNNREPDFSDFETIEGDESEGWARAALIRVLYEEGEDPAEWGVQAIAIDDDGTVYCPLSGHPMNSMFY